MRSRVNVIALFLALLFVTGCQTVSSSSQNIKTSQTTNNIALSNLDLAIAYMRQGQYEKALGKLDKAREADPGYAPTYNVLGLLYQQLGQTDQAEENFKKAIRLNSSDSATLNNYGLFLCQQNRRDEAEETFQKAANNPLYETPEIAVTNAGICVYNNGEVEKAEAYLTKALRLNPSISPALLLMAEISYNRNEALKARGYMQRYQQLSRHTPKSLWLGIQIEQELGDEDAISSYALLLKNQFPDSREAEKLRQAGIR